jgi:hypothetical protein
MTKVLVRARAWWFNKVPLTVTLCMLLLDGRGLTTQGIEFLVLSVLIVCSVGNYGYALNDLFDLNEDRALGRSNAVAQFGRRHVIAIVLVSGVLSLLLAVLAGGVRGLALTAAALALPACYSIPPVRLKDRGMLGAAADTAAAHVYPAMLALVAADHLHLRAVSELLFGCTLVWSTTVGLRGILSHQLYTADLDERVGVGTVVRARGRVVVERAVVMTLLPIEAGSFLAVVALADWTPGAAAALALYVVYEGVKTLSGEFVVVAFRPDGQPYIPMVEESLYKAWLPLALPLDSSRVDGWWAVGAVVYALLFRPLMRGEAIRLRRTAALLSWPKAKVVGDRSSAGS